MKIKICLKDREPYQSPWTEAVEISPSQIICGSNEDIESGGEKDWAPEFPGLFNMDSIF